MLLKATTFTGSEQVIKRSHAGDHESECILHGDDGVERHTVHKTS